MRKRNDDRPSEREDEGLPLEKHDFLAMWLAGTLTVGLPVLLIVAVVTCVLLLLFGRG
ncbi:MAG: hypothetical protein Q4G19_02160 [Clostridia bacterium]|nr:hypothetical protein [Clostridia bacterium]